MSEIRVIACGVVRHPRTGELLVDEIPEPGTERIVHRPPGGGVEFQERSADTVVREFEEEYGLAVRVRGLLDVLENTFTFGGQRLHSVLFLHEAELADRSAYDFERLMSRDAPHISAVWRPVSGCTTDFIVPGIADVVAPKGSRPTSAG